MNDVVALKIVDTKMGELALMTWGRVFDPVNDDELKQTVRLAAREYLGFRKVIKLEVCSSLAEVSHYKYFYEGLLQFAGEKIPFGTKTYKPWCRKMRNAIRKGKAIYVLGSQM